MVAKITMLPAWQIDDAIGLEDTDEQRGDKRTGDAAETPDEDDGEGGENDADVHAGLHRPSRHHGAGYPGQPASDREHAGEQRRDVDAHHGEHSRITNGGTKFRCRSTWRAGERTARTP